jgi:hypothetical protein
MSAIVSLIERHKAQGARIGVLEMRTALGGLSTQETRAEIADITAELEGIQQAIAALAERCKAFEIDDAVADDIVPAHIRRAAHVGLHVAVEELDLRPPPSLRWILYRAPGVQHGEIALLPDEELLGQAKGIENVIWLVPWSRAGDLRSPGRIVSTMLHEARHIHQTVIDFTGDAEEDACAWSIECEMRHAMKFLEVLR